MSPLPLAATAAEGRLSSLFWVAVLVVGVGFFAAEHMLSAHPVLEEEELATDKAMIASDVGTASRRLGLAAIGVFGLICLLRKKGNPLRARPLLATLMGLALLWTFGSLCWSVDPAFSLRRITALACCTLGAVGIGRQLRLEQLAQLTAVVILGYLGAGVLAEVVHGSFRPWVMGYRFAGTIHPNTQGAFQACLWMTGMVLLGRDPGRRRQMWAVLALSGLFLLLSGSRTSLAAATVAVALAAVLSGWFRRHALAAVWVLTLGAAMLFMAEVGGADARSNAISLAMMGRAEDAGQLAGRLPLWEELVHYVQQSPWIGYGYGAFWSPERIEEISAELAWDVAAAHSGYMELLLGLGVVGLLLVVLTAIVALAQVTVRCRRDGDAGHWFLFLLLTFALAQSVLESAFVIPSFLTFIAACGVCRIALFSQREMAESASAVGTGDGMGERSAPQHQDLADSGWGSLRSPQPTI